MYAPNPLEWVDPFGLARYPDSLSGRRTPNQQALSLTPHIHVNGVHIPVPPGHSPPGSTVITDSGPTTFYPLAPDE